MKCQLVAILFFACVFESSIAFSHTIYTKDGRTISSPEIWEDVQGYYIDDVSLYGYKTAGMPDPLVNKLSELQFQVARTKEQLFQRIGAVIGAANVKKFQAVLEKYIEEKVVISYEKRGNTLSLEKAEVEKIVYETPPPPLKMDSIHINDPETQQAIAAEEARLYEQLREGREAKNAAPAGSAEKREYETDAQKIQAKITELKHNPVGYFLRYYPDSVTLSTPLKPDECATLCGGTPSKEGKVATIANTSEEAAIYKRCVARCTNPKKGSEKRGSQKQKDDESEESGAQTP
ncbi:hypothetical protein U14_03596 [Candidatus Moduliflexus flocculans]|uniref:Uncharacterized protein n=1 Tax=Candidatus Moduliflexus flocculans TaxID=1499966 RepID=A0A081BPM9_9BACT|nr:hypothetical protein U14_03596 [Candidatus Moduliflexus flocculans]